MATIDRERYNLLYRPDLRPERDFRSEAVFEEPDIPVGAIVPEETIDDVLQDLKDLEEVSMGLPEGLDFVNEIVTKLRQRAEIIKVETDLTTLLNPPNIPSTTPPGTPLIIPPTVPTGGSPTLIVPPDTPPSLPLPVTVPTEDTVTPGTGNDITETVIVQQGTPTDTEGTPDAYTNVTIPTENYVYKKDDIPPAGTIIIPEEQPFVIIGSNIPDDPSAVPNLPTSFAPATDIKLSIETPKTLVEIAQESYKKDQIDLQKFYLQKMRMALQRYFHHLLGLTAELGLSNPDMLTKNYDGDNVTGVSDNFKHLHDTIVRSQIQRAQKVRLSKKMANADLTMTHMRAWHAAEKERERYYSEAYGNAETFVNSESNALLRQARSDYDAAYKLSLYNMYKYLDASVKLTEDILDHTLTEAKAKAKLTKEGVDIFKTKEITVTKDNNAVLTLKATTAKEREAEKAADQKEQARKKAGQDKVEETAEQKAERLTAARGVEDPDRDFGVAKYGGYYSKNDIDYLCNSEPEFYSRDTTTGKANVMAALDTSEKYAVVDEEQNKDQSGSGSTNQSENTVASSAEASVEGGSDDDDSGSNASVTSAESSEDKPVNQDSVVSSTEASVPSSVQAESAEKVGKATGEDSVTGGSTAANDNPTVTTGASDSDNGDTQKSQDIDYVISGAFSVHGYFKATRASSTDKWEEEAKITFTNMASSRIIGALEFKNGSWSTYGTNVGNNASEVIKIWEEHFGESWSLYGYGLIHTIIDLTSDKPVCLSSVDISSIMAKVTSISSYYH